MTVISLANFPSEIYYAICSAVYESGLPTPQFSSLDPLVLATASPNDNTHTYDSPTNLPSALPPSNWPEPLVRSTLRNLSLVNKAWYEAAKPWIWRRIEVRLPRNWLAIVEEVCGGDGEEEDEEEEKRINAVVQHAVEQVNALATAHSILKDQLLASLGGSYVGHGTTPLLPPESSIPPELLSPPASRDPSPQRLRGKSPGRWRLMRAVSDVAQRVETGFYVPTPDDPRPGRHVRHLDFNHFRTIGMRRSVGEGFSSRYVTSDRVERLLKEMPNLQAFGATEYIDSALSFPVLTELLFRGHRHPRIASNNSEEDTRGRGSPTNRQRRGRGAAPPSEREEDEDEEWERRADAKALQALDLCGCISAVFFNALAEFVAIHLSSDTSMKFTGLKRLGLRGVTSIPPTVLERFVLSFPSLTHLDLSSTLCTPDLLESLTESSTIRLKSLALSRCTRLTGESIAAFLIDAPCTKGVEELSLYGDITFPSPLSCEDLLRVIKEAPSFLSGRLTYLDLSSAPITKQHLDAFVEQPSLRSLGLSYISSLPLRDISKFVLTKALNTEILTLVGTSPELSGTLPARQVALAIHSQVIQPLSTAPFHFSLSTTPTKPRLPPTRLRVIELSTATLNALGGGSGTWRIVRSKGGRAWYLDTTAAWVNGELRRDLERGNPIRLGLERLAASNGNVSSGVGWHARKMEILHGQGLLGREDGLYGATSFAYMN